MLGERWKELSDKQKTPYEAKAVADKKRYEEEKKAYAAVRRSHIAKFSKDSSTNTKSQGAEDDEEEDE